MKLVRRDGGSMSRSAFLSLRLLDVLDLFAHLLDQQLQVQRHASDFDVDGFRAERIRFPVKFLHHEVQSLADSAAALENPFDLAEVRRKTRELLIDVDAVRKKRDLLAD